MALSGSRLKAAMQQRIYEGLVRVFSADVQAGAGYPPIANEAWMELADAISDSAYSIVDEIQANAEVVVTTPAGPGNGKVE
jgi:hypothetical protein